MKLIEEKVHWWENVSDEISILNAFFVWEFMFFLRISRTHCIGEKAGNILKCMKILMKIYFLKVKVPPGGLYWVAL